MPSLLLRARFTSYMTTWRFEHQKYKISDTQLLNPRSGFPCSLFLLIIESHGTLPAASAQTRSLISVSLCRPALTMTPSAPCVPLFTGLLALVLVSPPHTGARVMAEKHALCSLLKILRSCMSLGPVRCLPPPQARYSHLRAILIVTDAVSVGLPQGLCASASCPHPPLHRASLFSIVQSTPRCLLCREHFLFLKQLLLSTGVTLSPYFPN